MQIASQGLALLVASLFHGASRLSEGVERLVLHEVTVVARRRFLGYLHRQTPSETLRRVTWIGVEGVTILSLECVGSRPLPAEIKPVGEEWSGQGIRSADPSAMRRSSYKLSCWLQSGLKPP